MLIDGRRQVAWGSNFAVQEPSGGTGRVDGLVRGIWRQVYNTSGATLPYGAPIVLSTSYSAVSPSVLAVLPATSGDVPYGVVVEPGGIPTQTSGSVMTQGVHSALRVTGAITIHDVLYLSATSGYASATRPNAGAFGFARALLTFAGGTGTIPAEIQTFGVGLNTLPHSGLQGIQRLRGHTNLLLNAIYIRDNNLDDAREVIDGDPTTFETDFSSAGYLEADLGSELVAGGFEILYAKSTTPAATSTGTLKVWGSHDASNWIEQYTEPVQIVSGATPAYIRGGFKPQAFRYWRIGMWDIGGFGLFYEWALYESPGNDLMPYKIGTANLSYQSNGPLDDTLRRLDHHVDAITSSSSNQFVGTFDLRPGTGVAFSALSNTVTISATGGGGGGSTSYGSNSNSVSDSNGPGVISLSSRADHIHQGLHQLTSNTSNALYADVNLQAGVGIALGVAAQTITITNTGSGGGGSGGTTLGIVFPTTLTHGTDFPDGIFNWLGTVGNTQLFGNPATAATGLYANRPTGSSYTATQSTDQDGTRTAPKATDHLLDANNNCSHTQNIANSWWKANFGAGHTVTPTYIGICGRDGGGMEPRNFKLQGSNDDSAWTDLLTVVATGPNDNAWWSSAVTASAAYRYLRILQNGLNSSGFDYLVLGEVELWGTIA